MTDTLPTDPAPEEAAAAPPPPDAPAEEAAPTNVLPSPVHDLLGRLNLAGTAQQIETVLGWIGDRVHELLD